MELVQSCANDLSMSEHPTSHSWLTTVPPERSGRQTEKETADAVLDLVRAMGEGDIVEGLGKLEMLQALDEMRCDWMEVLQHGLPELTPKVSSERSPKLIKKSDS